MQSDIESDEETADCKNVGFYDTTEFNNDYDDGCIEDVYENFDKGKKKTKLFFMYYIIISSIASIINDGFMQDSALNLSFFFSFTITICISIFFLLCIT